MRKLDEINGIGQVLADTCIEKGYRSVEDIAKATVDGLATVPGVSRTRAKQLIDSAKLLLNGASQPETEPAVIDTYEAETPDESTHAPNDALLPESASLMGAPEKPVDSTQAPNDDALPSEDEPLSGVADEVERPVETAQAANDDAPPPESESTAGAAEEAVKPVESAQVLPPETAAQASAADNPKNKKKDDKKKKSKSKKDKKKSANKKKSKAKIKSKKQKSDKKKKKKKKKK